MHSRFPKLLLATTFLALAAWILPGNPAHADEAKGGDKLWKAKCASCHGPDGKGKTKQGDKMGIGDMSAPAWQKEFTDDKIKSTLADGIKREKNGKKQEMKPMKDKLTPEDITAVISFIRAFKP